MEMRQPPRFVPTLTDVVTEPIANSAVGAPPEPSEAFPATPRPTPFTELPVLQGVLQDAMNAQAGATPNAATQMPKEAEPDWSQIAQTLQTKVMQRLELHFQDQLHTGIADLVKLHTQKLCQAIQADIERLVTHAVQETLAEELELLRQSSAKR